MDSLVGVKGETKRKVTKDMLASAVGSGIAEVFATPMMIAGIEETAAASVQSFLDFEKSTVGINVNINHLAATPLGMYVTFKTEVVRVSENGKIITFKVEAFDECELIGNGTHERAVINKVRFQQKADSKLKNS